MGENRGRDGRILTPQRKGSYLYGSGLRCKVSSKLSENCDRRRGDKQRKGQRDRHTDGSDFIICPMLMLCYSDNVVLRVLSSLKCNAVCAVLSLYSWC